MRAVVMWISQKVGQSGKRDADSKMFGATSAPTFGRSPEVPIRLCADRSKSMASRPSLAGLHRAAQTP